MKNLTLLLLLFITYLFYSTSVASHIKPITSLPFSETTMLPPPLTTSDTSPKDNPKKITSSLVYQDKVNQDDKTFDQELQWRILNLLAQQLFQNNNDPLANDIFTSNWLYSTQTFLWIFHQSTPTFILLKS